MDKNDFINYMIIFSFGFLVITPFTFFPWATENWESLNGDVSVYRGQINHPVNIFYSCIPVIITLIVLLISGWFDKRRELNGMEK